MQDAGLVELAVDVEMLLQVSAAQRVEDAPVHQVPLEHVAVLGQPQLREKLVGHPRHVQLWGLGELAVRGKECKGTYETMYLVTSNLGHWANLL